jgi:protein-tyrosine phosphatase
MAEFVMKDLVKKANLEDQFHIESAATSTEEIGNPVYPPARRKLAEHGIDCTGKRARQLRNDDFDATWRDVSDGCWGILETLKNDQTKTG